MFDISICFAWAGIAYSIKPLVAGSTIRRSNTGGGGDFPHPFVPDLGPIQPPIQRVPGLFPGVKRPERGVEHPLSELS